LENALLEFVAQHMQFFDFLLPIFTHYGYIAVFVMLLICGFGVPVPEDVTLVTGGVIAGLGYANPHVMFAVGMAGVIIGDGIMFSLGRGYGDRIVQAPLFRRVLTPQRFEQAQIAFEKYGRWVMFVARFLPGLRTPVFFTAGMTRKVSFLTWFVMDGFAALISVPVWIYLGYFGAQNREWLFATLKKFQFGIFFLLGVGAIALFIWWRKKKSAAK
jgi:membrane protein DedA with SNARE-associated domain